MIKRSEIKFSVKVEEEDTDPRHYEYDPEVLKCILENMEASEYGWAYVVVTAEWQGFRGIDSLGGISCACKQEFEEHDLPNMKQNAVKDLADDYIDKVLLNQDNIHYQSRRLSVLHADCTEV